MVRLKDIAEVCGVSVATVSRALNGLTNENRERTAYILRTAKEMGYYPNVAARTLKTSRSNTIGVLYENVMTHEYFSSVLEALRRQADMRGYDLMMIGDWRGDKSGNYFEHVRRRNLDGVAVISADFDSSNVIRLVTSAIPSVIIDHFYEGCDCVSSDNRASMERIVRYAWGQGHRRIAMIHGEIGSVSRERLAGFYKYWSENAPDNWTIASDIMNCNGNIDIGDELAESFLKEHPDAYGLYGTNNGPTRVLCNIVREKSRTDIVVVGFDFSDEMKELIESPDYCASTMLQRQYDMGSRAVGSVLSILKGDVPPIRFEDTGVVTVNSDTLTDPDVEELLKHN